MKAKSWLSAALLLGVFLLFGPAASAELVLVRDGESLAPVFMFADAEAEQQVRANWEGMEQIAEEHPHAINGRNVQPNSARMRGLHPENIGR